MDCKCQFQHLWFLIAEETGVSGENDRAITSNWQTSWYKYVSSTSLYRQETIIMTDHYSYPELRGESSMEHMPTFTRCIMCIQKNYEWEMCTHLWTSLKISGAGKPQKWVW